MYFCRCKFAGRSPTVTRTRSAQNAVLHVHDFIIVCAASLARRRRLFREGQPLSAIQALVGPLAGRGLLAHHTPTRERCVPQS
jgi:hypothetical protein